MGDCGADCHGQGDWAAGAARNAEQGPHARRQPMRRPCTPAADRPKGGPERGLVSHVPLVSPLAGRTGRRRDDVDPRLYLGTDRLPRGCLKAANRLNRPHARTALAALEPWGRECAAEVGGGRHDRFLAEEPARPSRAPLAGAG
eukprot:11550318-Alexandrium_andersonii.AAC.1